MREEQIFTQDMGLKPSLFGQMVKDVKSALDAMECLTEEGRKNQSLCGTGSNFNGPYLPFPMPGTPTLDKSHFVLAGYSLGGNVALHAAALDNRVTAVASFAGFTPFKTDWNNKTTGGIKRLYSFHALIPRLGIFKDKYDEIPYDYDELLSSLIAPRPILLHTPMEDRETRLLRTLMTAFPWQRLLGRVNMRTCLRIVFHRAIRSWGKTRATY